ncbi:MAG: hypothetical protein HY578_06545 [Nitrospinae bacterium]|nr:hypothetical protein [Nitrospinota bacterium]
MKRVIYLSIFILSISYLLIFQEYGINLWDEGVLLNGSLRIMNGESVYRDFSGYPPGRYLVGATLFKIFGVNISVIRTAVTIMTSISVLMLYSISLRLIPPQIPPHPPLLKGGLAFIPSILFLVSPSVYYNRFYPIFTIFGIYVIYWYLDLQHIKTSLEKETPTSPNHPFPPLFKGGLRGVKGGERGMVLALSAIFAMFFKLEIGIGIMVISAIVILLKKPPGVGRIKDFTYFSLTLILLIICVTLYYAGSIDIYSLVSDIYFQVFKTYGLWGNPFPDIFSLGLWKRFNIHEIFTVILFYIPLIIYFLTFIILLRTPNSELRTLTAILLLFGIYVYNLVIWRTGFDNLMRCLPPAWILGCYLLYIFRMKLVKWTGEKIFSYALILLLPLWFLYEMIFYGDFYTGSIGEMRKTHNQLSMDRAYNIYADPVETVWINEITSYIKNNTSPDDTIFAIPLNPIWYFLTNRKNPTYYEWILPGELKTEVEQMEVIEQLKKKVPVFIIYANIAVDNREERRFSNYATFVYKFITDNYHMEKVVGLFQIWRLGK